MNLQGKTKANRDERHTTSDTQREPRVTMNFPFSPAEREIHGIDSSLRILF